MYHLPKQLACKYQCTDSPDMGKFGQHSLKYIFFPTIMHTPKQVKQYTNSTDTVNSSQSYHSSSHQYIYRQSEVFPVTPLLIPTGQTQWSLLNHTTTHPNSTDTVKSEFQSHHSSSQQYRHSEVFPIIPHTPSRSWDPSMGICIINLLRQWVGWHSLFCVPTKELASSPPDKRDRWRFGGEKSRREKADRTRKAEIRKGEILGSTRNVQGYTLKNSWL